MIQIKYSGWIKGSHILISDNTLGLLVVLLFVCFNWLEAEILNAIQSLIARFL